MAPESYGYTRRSKNHNRPQQSTEGVYNPADGLAPFPKIRQDKKCQSLSSY